MESVPLAYDNRLMRISGWRIHTASKRTLVAACNGLRVHINGFTRFRWSLIGPIPGICSVEMLVAKRLVAACGKLVLMLPPG